MGSYLKVIHEWKSFVSHPDVLITFVAPIDHYISSSWYEKANVLNLELYECSHLWKGKTYRRG